jgi:hypothetical protein
MIRGTVEGKGEVVLASRRAVDQALHEMGATRPIDIGSKELDATYLDSLVATAQRLLGDSFEQLRRRHERGKNSTTPVGPKNSIRGANRLIGTHRRRS